MVEIAEKKFPRSAGSEKCDLAEKALFPVCSQLSRISGISARKLTSSCT
jgi:hypothetical protein